MESRIGGSGWEVPAGTSCKVDRSTFATIREFYRLGPLSPPRGIVLGVWHAYKGGRER